MNRRRIERPSKPNRGGGGGVPPGQSAPAPPPQPPSGDFTVRIVKDGLEDAELPPMDFLPDLNYPPPNYFLMPVPPHAMEVQPPPRNGNPSLPPPPAISSASTTRRLLARGAGSSRSPDGGGPSPQLLLTSGPEVVGSPASKAAANTAESQVEDFFSLALDSQPQQHRSFNNSPLGEDVTSPSGSNPPRHSTDDLMGLLEELCHAEILALCGGGNNSGGGGGRDDESGGTTTPPFPSNPGSDRRMDSCGVANAFSGGGGYPSNNSQFEGSSYLDEDILNMVCVTPTGGSTERNGSSSSRSVSVDAGGSSSQQQERCPLSGGGGGGVSPQEFSLGGEEDEVDDDCPSPVYYPLGGDEGGGSDNKAVGGDAHQSSTASRSTLPTILASGEDFKDLILSHHRVTKPLTFLAHRVGPTVFLEGRPTAESEQAAGRVEELRVSAMRNKLLYYSKMLSSSSSRVAKKESAPSSSSPSPSSPSPASSRQAPKSSPLTAVPVVPTVSTTIAEEPPVPTTTTTIGVVGDSKSRRTAAADPSHLGDRRSEFKRAFKWKVQDMNVLIGVDTPIYKDPATGERAIMHLHDTTDDPEVEPPATAASAANGNGTKSRRQRQKEKKRTADVVDAAEVEEVVDSIVKGDNGAGKKSTRGSRRKSAAAAAAQQQVQEDGNGGADGGGVTNFAIEALEDDDEVDAAATRNRRGRVLGSAALASPTVKYAPPSLPLPSRAKADGCVSDIEEKEGKSLSSSSSSIGGDDASGGGVSKVLPYLDQEEALDMWIDAVMTNVRNVAVCLHQDGVVQGYQVVPINKLPTQGSSSFSPVTVQATATGILKWIQESTEGGTSFLIVKDGESSELRLFDLSDMRPGAPVPLVDVFDSHPDTRRRPWRDTTRGGGGERSLFVDPGLNNIHEGEATRSQSMLQKRLLSPELSTDLIVPPTASVSCLSDIDDDSPPPMSTTATTNSNAASQEFKQLGFPFAMMCFRMAQCLPNSDAECLRLWLRTIALLPPNSEESYLPLAVAHVHAMEHYHSSSPLPDAERVALTHCRQALQALHSLRLSILEIAMLSKPESRRHLTSTNSESYAAQLIDSFAEEDADIGSMVTEAKRLAIRIVKCMCAMAMQQLRSGAPAQQPPEEKGEGLSSRIQRQVRHASTIAVMIGRAMENILFAQEALALRSHEAPSGLIMANPELTASASPTTMSEADHHHPHSTRAGGEGRGLGGGGGASSANSLFPTVTPPPLFSSRFDVMACFEVVSSLSADIAARFLQTTVELRAAEAAQAAAAPSEASGGPPASSSSSTSSLPTPSNNDLVENFVLKANREVKVTLAVMNTAWRIRGSSLTGVETSTPEHINFVERITPFYADPIKTFDAASALYHVALAYNTILFSGRGSAGVALKRKVAGLNALVAETYSRHLVSGALSPPPQQEGAAGGSSGGGGGDSAKVSSFDQEEKAMHYYDRAAKSFIQCRDYANAARNFINAAKMSLRTTPLSSGGVTIYNETTFPKTEEAVAVAMRPVHSAIDFLELIDRFGSHLHSPGGVDAVNSIVAEAQQMLFGVYIFAFRTRNEFYVNPVTGAGNPVLPPYAVLPMTAAVESFLHDRYLSPASRLPKKFAKVTATTPNAPSEESIRRASEVKVLQLMLGLHWQCASPTLPIKHTPPFLPAPVSTANLSLLVRRRLTSARHAKHRLRQLWGGYFVYPKSEYVPFGLFLESCDLVTKVMQCDVFLMSVAGSGIDIGGEMVVGDLLEPIERCITAASELRPWIVAAANNQLDKQQSILAAKKAASSTTSPSSRPPAAPPLTPSTGVTSSKKKGKGKAAIAAAAVDESEVVGYVHLPEAGQALSSIPSLLSSALMSLLRLMKQSDEFNPSTTQSQREAEVQGIRAVVTKCLGLTPRHDVGVQAPDVVDCLDMATNIFKGKKRKQGGGSVL